LIQVKAAHRAAASVLPSNRERAMPTETVIVVAVVVAAFATFGAVLAYVDWIAGRRPDAHPTE